MLINLLIIFYLELVMNMKDFFEVEFTYLKVKKGEETVSRTAVFTVR